MDVTEAIGRVKGLLMIAADRNANGDANGAAAAALMIVDAINEGTVQPSDFEAAIAGGSEAGLDAEVDDFSSSMTEGDEEEDSEEDDAVEESTAFIMKQKILQSLKSK